MSPENELQVTKMMLNVDLKCSCCYKKVRNLLCKFPQIRDQAFGEDNNKVMITVVCCDPEGMRDKLCFKGGKYIKSIEILEPPILKPNNPKSISKPELKPEPEARIVPSTPKHADPTKNPTPLPVTLPMDPFSPRVSVCCQECYQGLGGGPCHYGYGRPLRLPPGPCNDGCRCCCHCGYRLTPPPPCYVTTCDYFSEENPQGCSIM